MKKNLTAQKIDNCKQPRQNLTTMLLLLVLSRIIGKIIFEISYYSNY